MLKLAKVDAQRPLTLEEARPTAISQLRSRKAERLLREGADAALAKIREAMSGGKSFGDAAAAAGLQVRSFSDLTPSDESSPVMNEKSPRPRADAAWATLQHDASRPRRGFALYSRAPLDEAGMAKKPELASRILESKRQLLFVSWLSSARDAAKITTAWQSP